MNDLKEASKILYSNLAKKKDEYLEKIENAKRREAAIRIELSSKENLTDTSENASHDNDLAAYMKVESELARYARRIEAFDSFNFEHTESQYIRIGTTIKLKRELINQSTNSIRNKTDFVLLLVPAGLGNASEGFLDANSAVGKELIHQQKGSTIHVNTASGTNTFFIEEIY